MSLLSERFASLVERLGARGALSEIFAQLYGAWDSASRHYHDVRHLGECLRAVDLEVASSVRDRVELALWYHDAVYEAGQPDCEARSAEWLLRDARSLGIDGEAAREAARFVEATAHGKVQVDEGPAALVVDIDLSILGSDPSRFMEFEHGVEKEYAALPTEVFRRGRGAFLSRMLEEPIYRTPAYRERFEAAARANIAGLLTSERYRAYLL